MKTAFQELIDRRRTVRRFSPQPVPRSDLITLADWARLGPSAANRQPLGYVIVDEPELVEKVFSGLKFAAYLGAAGQPQPGERPTAYIIITVRDDLGGPEAVRDVGAAAMTICLGACALGLGACWLRSADRKMIGELIKLPEGVAVDSVIALGYPASAPVLETMAADDGFKYWRDENGVHHVPKRPLNKVVSINTYGNPPAED